MVAYSSPYAADLHVMSMARINAIYSGLSITSLDAVPTKTANMIELTIKELDYTSTD